MQMSHAGPGKRDEGSRSVVTRDTCPVRRRIMPWIKQWVVRVCVHQNTHTSSSPLEPGGNCHFLLLARSCFFGVIDWDKTASATVRTVSTSASRLNQNLLLLLLPLPPTHALAPVYPSKHEAGLSGGQRHPELGDVLCLNADHHHLTCFAHLKETQRERNHNTRPRAREWASTHRTGASF